MFLAATHRGWVALLPGLAQHALQRLPRHHVPPADPDHGQFAALHRIVGRAATDAQELRRLVDRDSLPLHVEPPDTIVSRVLIGAALCLWQHVCSLSRACQMITTVPSGLA